MFVILLTLPWPIQPFLDRASFFLLYFSLGSVAQTLPAHCNSPAIYFSPIHQAFRFALVLGYVTMAPSGRRQGVVFLCCFLASCVTSQTPACTRSDTSDGEGLIEYIRCLRQQLTNSADVQTCSYNGSDVSERLTCLQTELTALLNALAQTSPPTPLQPANFIETLTQTDVSDFRYCRGLHLDQCKSLMSFCENMLSTIEESSSENADRSRRTPRSTEGILESIKRKLFVLQKRSRAENDVTNAKNVLRQYQKWRKDNGYGRAVGRWGRSIKGRTTSKEIAVSGSWNSLNRLLPDDRYKRAIPNGMDPELRSILMEYKNWRRRHGYGSMPQRWGR